MKMQCYISVAEHYFAASSVSKCLWVLVKQVSVSLMRQSVFGDQNVGNSNIDLVLQAKKADSVTALRNLLLPAKWSKTEQGKTCKEITKPNHVLWNMDDLMELVYVCATLDSIKGGHSWLDKTEICFKHLLYHLPSCLGLGPLRCSTPNCQCTKPWTVPKATGCLIALLSSSLRQTVWCSVCTEILKKARWVPGAHPELLERLIPSGTPRAQWGHTTPDSWSHRGMSI